MLRHSNPLHLQLAWHLVCFSEYKTCLVTLWYTSLFHVLNLFNSLKSLQQWPMLFCSDAMPVQVVWILDSLNYIRYRFPTFDHFTLRLCWKITRTSIPVWHLPDNELSEGNDNHWQLWNYPSWFSLLKSHVCPYHKKSSHTFRVDISLHLKHT